jgi:hypothetical protein
MELTEQQLEIIEEADVHKKAPGQPRTMRQVPGRGGQRARFMPELAKQDKYKM